MRLGLRRGANAGRHAATVCVALAFGGLGCKKEPPPTPAPPAPAQSASAKTEAATVESAAAKEKKPKPAAGPSAQKLQEEAKAKVESAVKLAGEKAKCESILPDLDVEYALAGPESLDERTLTAFASCAASADRWQLLRDVATDLAASSPALKTTYFLPRALIGEGDYEPAHTLAKETLRLWPKEGDAYTTGALASLRTKDWDGAVKAADQALLVARRSGGESGVAALAHAVRGAALLHMGKMDEGVHEVDLVKDAGALALADISADAAKAAKDSGVLATITVHDEAYPELFPLYTKKIEPLGGLVTVTLQNLSDKPVTVTTEVELAGAESAADTVKLVKGRPVTVALTPAWKPNGALGNMKTPEAHDVTVTLLSADRATILKAARPVRFEPRGVIPRVLREHGADLRSASALAAAWVTPGAPEIKALLAAAKAHAAEAKGEGHADEKSREVEAVWNELRRGGFAFRRDPMIDSETRESLPCRSPSEVAAAKEGDALESTLLFASLLEGLGLDVVLVRTPGHRMVGWLHGHVEGESQLAVKTPLGPAFLLETTMVAEAPFDAALIQGTAEWVAETNAGAVARGDAEVASLKALRQKGIVSLEEPTAAPAPPGSAAP